MTSNNDPTSVRTSVVVAVDRAHAFAVFTERFDTWWPRSHYNGPGELAEIGLEPHPGGRWFTRSTDGSMGTFGSVLLWDPPARLILGWQLNAEFNYDPDLVTELEISFTEIQPHRTLVELEHRHLDRYGPAAARMRGSFGSDNGWTGILKSFAELTVVDPMTEGGSDHGQSRASGGLMET